MFVALLTVAAISVAISAALAYVLFRPRYDSTVRYCDLCTAWVATEHIHTQETEDAFDAWESGDDFTPRESSYPGENW